MSKTNSKPSRGSNMPTLVEDCRGVLKVFSDGSIVRSDQPSFPHPYEDDGKVLWKDVLFEPSLGLELRIYIPSNYSPASSQLLPIFFYFHGGGYCIGSRTWGNFHNYCLRLAVSLNAVVLAPDYRLGPENRLPVPLDDGFAALRWVYSQSENLTETWLSGADFGRVFVSGDSAGGGIAHHVAVRAAAEPSWGRVKIKGYVLLMPFFGGVEHTPSEATCPPEAFLNLELNDRYWRLSLPLGADRDHPVANPFGPGAPCLKEVELPAMLVIAGGRDLLRDRGVEYVEKLKEYGKEAEVVVFEGEQHGFFTITPTSPSSVLLMARIASFLQSHS